MTTLSAILNWLILFAIHDGNIIYDYLRVLKGRILLLHKIRIATFSVLICGTMAIVMCLIPDRTGLALLATATALYGMAALSFSGGVTFQRRYGIASALSGGT